MKKVLFPFFALVSLSYYSQSYGEVKVKEIGSKKVSIEFICATEIQSVVVMISDSGGTTLFMENRFRFKGSYKWVVDFEKQSKGRYVVDVIRDDKKYSSTFILK